MFLAGLVLGCAATGGPLQTTATTPSEPDVVLLAENDYEMRIAEAKAQRSIGRFIEALASPAATQTYFAVKTLLRDGERAEHVWVSRLSYDGARFQGTVANAPFALTTVTHGDALTVAPGDITDWMIVEDQALVGGYTIRLERDRMSVEQRADFDGRVGFAID
jgi:uncharacterized protein YegJ (DUF2314 family)